MSELFDLERTERRLGRWVLERLSLLVSALLVLTFAAWLLTSCSRPLTVARAACDLIEVLQTEAPDERLERAQVLLEQGEVADALLVLRELADALAAIDGARAPSSPSSDAELSLEPSERQADVRALITLVERALERGEVVP